MRAKAIALRLAYGAGIISAAVLALNADPLFELVFPREIAAQLPPELVAQALDSARMGFAVVAVPLIVLLVRPYWWGKLFVLWPAFSWMGFAGASTVISGWSPILLLPLACGGVMLAIALTHQLLDPRWSGPPLR